MDQASSSPAALIWIRRSPVNIVYRSPVLGAVSNLVSEPPVMCNYTYHQRIYTHSLNLSSPLYLHRDILAFPVLDGLSIHQPMEVVAKIRVSPAPTARWQGRLNAASGAFD